MEIISILIAVLSFTISAWTWWSTDIYRGSVKMTYPPMMRFSHDDLYKESPQVYLRMLLYSTAKRGNIIESIYLKHKVGNKSYILSKWICKDEKLHRGSGLYIGKEGIVCDHYFILPRVGESYSFIAGENILEIYARVINKRKPILLKTIKVILTKEEADTMKTHTGSKIHFDIDPETNQYYKDLQKQAVIC